MSFLSSSLNFLYAAWRIARIPFLVGVGLAIGFLVPYAWYLDSEVRSRFDDLSWDLPSRVYARPLTLAPGVPMNADMLGAELAAARYDEDAQAQAPGTFHRDGARWTIKRRTFIYLDGREREKRIALTLANGRVADLVDADSGAALERVRLDPARIATLYGAQQEDRRYVTLGEIPPLLLSGLQAVEDRDFKHHHGINVGAIVRAAWANLVAGHVVQGGSTLTQQLVKNLFLDRGQRFSRKFNEALLSLIIEARYDKKRILEAYVNEVFLGQQGAQAVHGFAAASEFYFGRDLRSLGAADIALLVGMVQGPSLYDPRRNPERALGRRNVVLGVFRDTGLLDDAAYAAASRQPIGTAANATLPRDRYPAFLELVRRQIREGFPDAELNSAGLSIHTTLAPSVQALGEAAIDKALAGLGKRGDAVEAALVVTGARDGEVQAVIGSRDVDAPGFNRALDALRPIGSLVKPFVNLVALAQPQRYSLATLLDDGPIDLPQPGGGRWRPENDDRQSHGEVLLVDALMQSWNLATINLGQRIGVDRVRGFLESFRLGRAINPNPSMLLGAIDLSPFDVARLYQYLAADGHALPLRAVRGVLDAKGRPLSRYEVKVGGGDYTTASRLVTWAMQQVAIGGTAHAITDSGLGWLHAAGKTGTSDTQRDSWFAGFTGDTLAVAWVGRDDNKPTGLFGSTGGLRIWIELMKRLPGAPLVVPQDGIERAYVAPSGKRTDAVCAGARELPFALGYAPTEEEHCPMDQLRNFFGSGG
ncbi:penicillin-binding protein 1B [Dokdonella fugitiva]|uniref:penicillin-binding protein 1B n=1 Tax=Dokdonella fugitiva TaxID=328517 RepID=UPI0015FE4204|nr:penicillin-binding protein 1B [Dokdonella fugitiva]MBA8884599.1 penicillin-binding protein 1B [Dokdonella fugitiva]